MTTPEMGHPLLDGFYRTLGEPDDGAFRVANFRRIAARTYRITEYYAAAENFVLPETVTMSVWPRVVAEADRVRITEPPMIADVALDDPSITPTVLERFVEFVAEELYVDWRNQRTGHRVLDAFIDRQPAILRAALIRRLAS